MDLIKPDLIHFSEFHCDNFQQCSIVQLCIVKKLEAFCMPDVGGDVISGEFSRVAQLNNTHAVRSFTARTCIRLPYRHGIYMHRLI